MTHDASEWLTAPPTGADDSRGIAAHHLETLRRLLDRDYLNRADWEFALSDLARMAKEALGADSTLVAVLDEGSGRWSAVNSDGAHLAAPDISEHGSTAILDAVRREQEPILTTGATPLELDSASITRHEVESVLAVPLYWWDVTREQPERRLGGCLYAHRTAQRMPFAEHDIALVRDIARIAQPNLNLLRYLRDLQTDLQNQQNAFRQMRQDAEADYRLGDFETTDSWFARHVITPLRRVAQADRVGLLIIGPTGSGKSHLARAFHYASMRRDGPFITLDCSQVTSATTLTAELFGYARDSGYANAPTRGRPGKARLADGGTLFIDEIGTLPAELQRKLLRLIQDGTFSPLGSSEELQVDIQVIAATNEDLEALVGRGEFREDLYWRIREIAIELPPLNGRVADIPHLVAMFLDKARARFKKSEVESFSREAMHALVSHDWSRHGNIRGLEHVVNRAVLLAAPGTRRLGADDLQLQAPLGWSSPTAPPSPHQPRSPDTTTAPRPPASRGDSASEARAGGAAEGRGAGGAPEGRAGELRSLLIEALERHEFNVRALARDALLAQQLGYEDGQIPLSTLYDWLRDVGLNDDLKAMRDRHREALYQEVADAIREHGSGSAAAKALGISRNVLVGRLRAFDKTISDVLAEG